MNMALVGMSAASSPMTDDERARLTDAIVDESAGVLRITPILHVLQVGRGPSDLPAPGGPVGLDRHSDGSGPRFDQLERSVLAERNIPWCTTRC